MQPLAISRVVRQCAVSRLRLSHQPLGELSQKLEHKLLATKIFVLLQCVGAHTDRPSVHSQYNLSSEYAWSSLSSSSSSWCMVSPDLGTAQPHLVLTISKAIVGCCLIMHLHNKFHENYSRLETFLCILITTSSDLARSLVFRLSCLCCFIKILVQEYRGLRGEGTR